MTDMRTRIDELIEESYLVTLTEEKIRQDLLSFLHVCAQTTEESDLSDEMKREIARRLDRYNLYAIDLESAEELISDEDEDQWKVLNKHEQLAHRAARLKMLVLDAIRGVNSSFADELERKRFPNMKRFKESSRSLQLRRRFASAGASASKMQIDAKVLRIAYALLAGATLFLVGYRLIN